MPGLVHGDLPLVLGRALRTAFAECRVEIRISDRPLLAAGNLPNLAHQLLDVGPAAPERLHRKRPQHDIRVGTRLALLPDGLRPFVRGMRLARLRGRLPARLR